MKGNGYLLTISAFIYLLLAVGCAGNGTDNGNPAGQSITDSSGHSDAETNGETLSDDRDVTDTVETKAIP